MHPLSDPPASYDFSGVTDGLAALGTAMVGPAGIVLGSALLVAGVFWGFPKLIGLFKKAAK